MFVSCVCFAGDGHGGDDGGSHLESDSAGSEVPTFVDVPVNGPTPAGNCFQLI